MNSIFLKCFFKYHLVVKIFMLTKLKSLKANDGLMRIFSNTSWLLGEKIIRMAFGLLVGVWVARYLGPEQFGIFNYAQSFVALFSVLATLGLDSIVVRELVHDDTRKNLFIGTVFCLKLVGAFVLIVLLSVSFNFTSNDRETNTLILIIATATIFQSFSVIELYFQSKVMGKYIAYANMSSLLISSAGKIALIVCNAKLIFFAFAVLFDSVVLALAYIYFYQKHHPNTHNIKSKFEWKFDINLARHLLSDSWPLILSGAASIINMRMDQVLLANMTSFSTVGNYAVAVRLSEVWFVLPSIIGASIYPSIISAKKRSIIIYRARIISTVKHMSLFAFPFAVLISLFSNPIIHLLYGNKYEEAGLFLALHIWSGVPYLTLFVYSQVTVIEKLTKLTFYISVYAVLLNLFLNYILIPIYGGIGAAVVTLIVAWSSVLITIFWVERKANILKVWGNK